MVGRVARHDILLYVTDFNAVIGSSNEGFEAWIGAENYMNNNRFLGGSFCIVNDLVIGGTLFQHPDIQQHGCLFVGKKKKSN